ncbi:cell division protein CrgA [Bacillus sp. NPDC077027]|uniref:cell division protein CrgA n=1 Tax=Bacillus sp. NPDC077027 TaxID=3390548 RepID=UPI003CFC5561
MERDEDFKRNDREIDTHFSNDDGYLEETAAEITEPYQASRDREERYNHVNDDSGSKGIGYTALAIAIISLFVMPVLLGVAAIVVGYIARRKGARALGAWSIGIGIVSVVLGIFITPFF